MEFYTRLIIKKLWCPSKLDVPNWNIKFRTNSFFDIPNWNLKTHRLKNHPSARQINTITGEGSLDSQTLQGKGPYGVAVKAKAKRIPVIGLAGKVESSKEMENYFDELICINNEAVEIAVAMKNTAKNLVSAAKMIGNRMTSIK